MSDEIIYKTEDTQNEHWCHQSYHNDCSDCYKEARLIKNYKTVNFENTIKTLGAINKAIYGVNPYE